MSRKFTSAGLLALALGGLTAAFLIARSRLEPTPSAATLSTTGNPSASPTNEHSGDGTSSLSSLTALDADARPVATEAMRETLEGLDALFTDAQLAFRSDEPMARVAESLADYQSNWMLGAAKLQRALDDLNAAQMGGVFTLFQKTLPPEQSQGVAAYRLLFRFWGGLDGATALAAAMSELPPNPVRLESGREAMRGWARLDPASAATATAALPAETYGRDYVVYAVPYTYMASDPQSAMAWANALPADLRTNTLQHCMIKWLQDDPAAALAYTTDLAGQPAAVDSGNGIIFTRMAGALARSDLAQATHWVEQLPEAGKARQQATLGLIDWWGMHDPAKAGAWLLAQPPSRTMDAVMDHYVRDAMHWVPEAAADWAQSIKDPVLRGSSVRAVFDYWATQDPDAARAWARRNAHDFASPVTFR